VIEKEIEKSERMDEIRMDEIERVAEELPHSPVPVH
jgi:hypothetical protein